MARSATVQKRLKLCEGLRSGEELTHHKIDLEAAVQPNEEGVVRGGLEDVLFRLYPIDILVVRHQLLLDHLHCVDAPVLLQLHHQHLQKTGQRRDKDQARALSNGRTLA